MKKNILLWLVALVFMLFFAVYQRMTGPTHPARGKIEIAGETVNYRLLRSWGKTGSAKIEIPIKNPEIEGFFKYRRFKSYDEWTEVPMRRHGDRLVAFIPHQPPAGKVMYNIRLQNGFKSMVLKGEPVVLRFTGIVPGWVIIPHVIIMFLAMVFAMRALLEAIYKGNHIFILTMFTFLLLFLGGIVLGPIVQKYAFNAYWTGWPFGHDLTDNKVLVSFLLWLVALIATWRNRKHRAWVIVAGIGLIAVYLIPHSLLGSELDYTKLKK